MREHHCPSIAGESRLPAYSSFQRWSATKPKPRWDVHLPGAGNRGGSLAGVFRPLIAGPSGSAVSPRLSGWSARPGIFRPSPALPPCCPTQIASGLISRPTPDSRIGVEVRTVARQVHQPQPKPRRPQVLPHRLAPMRWRVVPDDLQRSRVLSPQLHQEGNRGLTVAVALQFHPFHLSRLQTHRRIVASTGSRWSCRYWKVTSNSGFPLARE